MKMCISEMEVMPTSKRFQYGRCVGYVVYLRGGVMNQIASGSRVAAQV